jgi:hypothetical protein
VVLITAVVAGLLITVLRAKLTGRHLKPIELKISWLVFVAVIPQFILFQIPAIARYIPEAWIPIILVISQALLVGFAAANVTKPGFGVLGFGSLANFLAIVFNGGWMPISPETVRRILPALPYDFDLVGRRLGQSKDWIFSNSDIHLPWLSDRFTLPGWISYKLAFSVGDVMIAIGAILLLWSLSNPDNRRQHGTANSGGIY